MAHTTRDRLSRAITEHPTLTASEHARALGVSRERIRQLAESLGVVLPKGAPQPARARRPPKAPLGPSRPRVAVLAPAAAASPTTRGTIGELIVAADLLARCFQVYAPITRHAGRCDLIALTPDGRRTIRVEVRTGTRGPAGELRFNSHGDAAHYDVLAIVVAGEPILYRPTIEHVAAAPPA